jgi:uncharacterized protein YbjT (DUF2867 family)
MRILVLGAYGLIGSTIAARLAADGHEITGLGRNVDQARRQFPTMAWIARDLRKMTRASDWTPLLQGVDAVVNCAGALQDSPRDDLAVVHVTAPLALAEACLSLALRRFIHISALGADAGRAEPFSATKHAFERKLASLDLDWVILRPALVWSPQAYGGTALLRGLAGFPLVIPVVYSDAQIQIVSADDVGEAVSRAVSPGAPARIVCDLAHSDTMTVSGLLTRVRAWLGLPPAPVVRAPTIIARIAGRAADALALAGWRSPMRTAALEQLRAGVTGKAEDAKRLFGFEPESFDDFVLRHPAGVQERWFARLYFLKPLSVGVLNLFWLTSGAVGLLRLGEASGVLTAAGWSSDWARGAVIVGSLADIALGLAMILRRWTRPALLGTIAVSLFYLAAASLNRSDLWLDPLGPLVKTAPAIVLALVAMALQDER